MNTEFPYLQLFVRDQLAEVGGLDAEERGVHLSLLLHCWSEGGSLPADPRRLARLAGIDPSRWEGAWDAIRSLWQEADGRISSAYVTAELVRAREAKEARQRGANATNAKRSAQRDAHRTESDPLSARSAGRSSVGNSASASASASASDPGSTSDAAPHRDGDGPGRSRRTSRTARLIDEVIAPRWEAKYGRRFTGNDGDPRALGRLLSTIDDMGEDGRRELAELPRWYASFLADDEPYLVKNAHPLKIFCSQIDKYRLSDAERKHANGQLTGAESYAEIAAARRVG